MALRDVLLEITSTLGLDDLTDPSRRQYYIDKINMLAEEMYGDYDFPGILREHVFQLTDTETSQLSLPYYVGNIRGVRIFNTYGGKVNITTMRPRYHSKAWNVDLSMQWREKTKDSYLKRDLEDFTPLTFTLKDVETSDVVIDVTGQTDYSSKVAETVTIPAGNLTVTTANAYITVKFNKLSRNTFNILVTDVNNNEVAEIPNHLLRSFYTIVQLRDNNQYVGSLGSFYDTFEILYKERFFPMIELSDEYIAPNCDRMLFWKFAEWWESTQPGHEDRAILAKAKVDDLINSLLVDDEDSQTREACFGKNRFIEAQRSSYDPLTNPWSSRYIL